jgi:UDP-2,3-diacylglucosamine pyrophosphatase LpxH
MKQWRTIIMSDLHLGSRQSQTDKILKFLDENESETLILNGDIIDGWALKSGGKWKSNCSKIFRKFMKRSEKGTKVVYIRGNHDDFLKPFIPFNLNNIEIVRKYVHIGADGRSYYCYHGDVLDFVIMEARWLAVLGGLSYDFVIRFNTLYNYVRKLFKLPYHSLANVVKQSVKGAINFISDFEDNAKALTIQKGYDVAVCGHIHHPKLEEDYMNSGDFCENATCLVEDFDGNWLIFNVYNQKEN